jgi:uncharacterized protein YkwD
VSARQGIGLAIVALAVAASFLVPGIQTGSPEPKGPTRGCEGARGEPAAGATLCLLNAERGRHGLRPLRQDGRLARAARRHARDMAARDYFAHESPEGTQPHERILRAGYRRPRLTGENLARGEAEAGAPSAIVDGWMHSPGHRENILRRGFEEIGIGIVVEDGEAFYATTFGAR